MTEHEATKQRIEQELERVEFLIGTTPPDDEFFAWLLNEQSLLEKLLRYMNIGQ